MKQKLFKSYFIVCFIYLPFSLYFSSFLFYLSDSLQVDN